MKLRDTELKNDRAMGDFCERQHGRTGRLMFSIDVNAQPRVRIASLGFYALHRVGKTD